MATTPIPISKFIRSHRLFRWALSTGVLWLLLVPWLRWYGPPQPVWSVKLHREERINKMARDGSLIVTRQGDIVCLWNTSSGMPIGNGYTSLEPLTISDDCRRFAKIETPTNKEWALVIVESATGTVLHRISLASYLLAEEVRIRHRLDDVSSWAELWFLREIVFLPDDSSLAVIGWLRPSLVGPDQASTLHVFDIASGNLLHQHSGDYHSRPAVTRSQDGRLLLRSVVEPNVTDGGILLSRWELVEAASSRIVALLTPGCSETQYAEFMDQDRVIVGGSQGSSRELIGLKQHALDCFAVHLWDANTGLEIARFEGETLVSVSSDRASFVTSLPVKQGANNSFRFRLRDAVAGSVRKEWSSHRENQSQNIGESGLYVSQDRLYQGPDQAPLTSTEWWSRSWWRWLWPWPFQTSVRTRNPDRIVRAVCGGGAILTPDGRLVVVQTLAEDPPPKFSAPQKWRWTMSAYLVAAAMPWTAAAWWGFVMAVPLGLLSRWRPWEKSAAVSETTSHISRRVCPACGKLSPARMAKCYHCGTVFTKDSEGNAE